MKNLALQLRIFIVGLKITWPGIKNKYYDRLFRPLHQLFIFFLCLITLSYIRLKFLFAFFKFLST
jgi:hypothetical protein